MRIIFRSNGNYMVALASQGRNFELISLGNATIWDAKAKRMQSIKSLPSRKFQGWEAAEMRWDWNPSHRLNCFGRAHSCCCWKRRVKSCLLTFHFLLTLFLSCLVPVPIPNGFPSVSQVLSLLFIVTSALKAVSKIWYVLNICLINWWIKPPK